MYERQKKEVFKRRWTHSEVECSNKALWMQPGTTMAQNDLSDIASWVAPRACFELVQELTARWQVKGLGWGKGCLTKTIIRML